MIPKREKWYADLPELLKAEALWQSGTYNETACREVHVSKTYLTDFLRDFYFNEQEIQCLFRLTDSHGKFLLHESFINYLQRFSSRLEVNDTGNDQFTTVCGPVLQLALLKLVLPVI
jgi:nicotinic acid phosphoribosyltransferase